ncbi:hypothetical protein ACFSTE_07565 [Aquimarina hainanensis]|uniref:Uncharacterized protein n=1 Tax=Aquimarina hainanensis TaxID=1578017 RepID=A0ABW5N7U7_9FLAO
MENQLFFYDLFISVLGIVLFLYYLYKIITTIKGSYKSVSNRSDIVAFIKKADKVVIDLLEVTFRSQVNQKESFDFTFFENEIIPETEKPNIYRI